MKRRFILWSAAIAMVQVALLPASWSIVFAQQNTNPANKELPLRELVKLPGRLLAESNVAGQRDELKLTGYRVEEVRLPRSLTVEVRGRQTVVDTAWRVTVTGGPFPVRAMPAVIWIDDQIAGYGIENETLSQITAVTFDNSLIREGGVISLSYGETKETRVRLSQKLQLKREGENQ